MKVSGQSSTRGRVGRGRFGGRAAAPPGAEGLGGEPREGAAGVDPGEALGDRGQARGGEEEVGQARGPGGEGGPAGQPAEAVVGGWAEAAAVGLVEDLGLVGGHVDAGRAVGGAALAGQAEVEGLADLGRGQAADQGAVDRLLEDPAAAPGGVLLVPGRQPGRAHHPAGGGVVGDAAPDPRAAVDGAGQVAPVLGVAEPQPPGDRPGHGAAQVGVERPRAHQHPRVEQVARVEDGLDGGHGPDRVRRVHQRQQLGPGPPVAVLPRHRPAVGGDQRGRLLDERPVDRLPAGPVEGEVDAHVQAAVAEMAVGDAVEAVAGQQGLELAQVGAEALGRDGRVLPAGPGRRPGRAAAAEPGPVLADAPDGGRLRPGRAGPVRPARRRPAAAVSRAAAASASAGVAPGQLGQQPAAALGEVGNGPAPAPDHLDDAGVDALEGHRVHAAGPRRRRRRRRPCPGSRARPGRSPPAPGRAGRSPPGPRPGCPRCRPGPGPGRRPAPGAGAPARSRSPGGRSGRTGSGSAPRAARTTASRPGTSPTAPGAGHQALAGAR